MLSEYLNKIKTEYIKQGGDSNFIITYIEECVFGFNEINPIISKDQNILEIGSGSGLLATYLSSLGYRITGLEPFDKAFNKLELILNTVKIENKEYLKIIKTNIEAYETPNKYDIIFSINVFEHVEDINYCINKAIKLLANNGKLIILCPNYSFPYEPHFNIPIIVNKKITYYFFSSYINKNKNYYKCWNTEECWESLNWINYKRIKKLCNVENYSLYIDKDITQRIIDRLLLDKALIKRKGFLVKICKLINMINLPYLYSFLPGSFQPYLKLTINK